MKKEDINSMFLYGNSIIDIIDRYVQDFTKSYFTDDKCPPIYTVSLYNGDMNNQHILVTITHHGLSFTENIFPRNKTEWGYDSLESLLINMYNKTM